MSKSAWTRQNSARERIAAQRAAARRAEIRNRVLITGGTILAVIAVVAVFVVIKLNQSPPGSHAGAPAGGALPASVTKTVTSVPASVLDTVGAGSVPAGQGKIYADSPVKRITGGPLMRNGKPEMLYIGAEFCPYCAELRQQQAVWGPP